MFDPDVPQFKVGDLLTAAALNDIVSQLNTLKKQFNDRNQPTRNDSRIDHWMGVLRDTGPNSEANYTDARYWVQRLEAATSSTTNLLNVSANTMTFPDIEKGYVTATNISEISLNSSDALTSTGSHTLNEGTLVHVFAIQRNTNPPAKFYWFHYAIGTMAIVKITSNAAGNGKYNARILTGLSTATATTNLSMPAGMTVPGADNALFLNLPESGGSGHNLTTNSFAMGLIVGTTTETTPRKIVMGTSLSYACGN